MGKAEEAAFEGDPYTESLAEEEKEMEDDAEFVDELMAKYAHLPPEQRARIQKLSERETPDVDAADKYATGYVDYNRGSRRREEGESRQRQRREKWAKEAAEAETKGEL